MKHLISRAMKSMGSLRGVVPDIEIGLDRETLLKGIDPQLRAAVGYIEKAARK